ncbi:MAG: hypothetical protein FWE90_11765 [Defluviitaleaceae bacterium]|nr:hypothetical protein [Defluviitaleaceae bacterium]
MKGNEIMNHITRDKMPDMEQVREICHTQTAQTAWQRPSVRRLRWYTAAIITAVSLAFASTAYAVGVMIYERSRLDTGGTWEYVFVPEDDPEYIQRRDDAHYGRLIYNSPNAVIPWRFLYDDRYFYDEPENAAAINGMLSGKVFLADGSPFPYDLLVHGTFTLPAVNPEWADYGPFIFEGYHIDSRGHLLYNAAGEEIGYIRAWSQHSKILRLEILTVEEYEEKEGYKNTFEEAVAFLGREPRLPAVNTEKLNPPIFDIKSWVSVMYVCNDTNLMNRSVRIHIENARGSGEIPWERSFPGAAAEYTIVNTTVFKITGHNYATHFIWLHDGLVYRMYPPTDASDDWIRDVIGSLVR